MPSKHNPFEHLFSKLLAGGLSAGLVLAWWPVFFHSEGVMSWVWRGLAWTLLFELLLAALAPLEEAVNRHPRYLRLKGFLTSPFRRLGCFTPDSPVLSAALLAVGALALPVGLMVSRAGQVKPEKPVKLVKVTKKKVVRPVKVVKLTKVEVVRPAAPVTPAPAPSVSSPEKPKPQRPKSQAQKPQSPDQPVAPEPLPQPLPPDQSG